MSFATIIVLKKWLFENSVELCGISILWVLFSRRTALFVLVDGGIQTMYEEPYLKIMFLTEDDVIRTSGEWEDDNVVDDGWT